MNPIDKYIRDAAPFARPVLVHLRALVHEACPEVQETLKWRFPHFLYKGILCSMAAFKQHCAFGFWKGKLLFADNPKMQELSRGAMGYFGRITSLEDLPDDHTILKYVREAMRLNEDGVKSPVRPLVGQRKPLVIPTAFSRALMKNKQAKSNFENFSYSQRKEYVQWISEAKREETREKRIATSIDWLAEGKSQNWRYERC